MPRKPSPRLHFAKIRAGLQNCWQRDMTMSYTIFNKYKIDKSRVPKCYAMTTNLRLKNPTCRAYIFKRLLSYVFNQINNSYVFNQINNFIIVLIETVGQKNKNPRLRDLAAKNSRIRDAKKHKKTRFRDSFKTPPRFRDWNKTFRDPEFSGYHSPPLILEQLLGLRDVALTVQ